MISVATRCFGRSAGVARLMLTRSTPAGTPAACTSEVRCHCPAVRRLRRYRCRLQQTQTSPCAAGRVARSLRPQARGHCCCREDESLCWKELLLMMLLQISGRA